MPEQIPLPSTPTVPLNSIQRSIIEGEIVESLKQVYDPELPVNIYDLGLIYGIELDEHAFAMVRMTLTSPACPVAGTLPGEVEMAVAQTPGVRGAQVELVWDPPYSLDMMPEHVKLQLGLM